MTISDADLEHRLRDLRLRADEIAPAPFDLAERTRDRHRIERRRMALTAAGLAAALVLVGLPTVASGWIGNRSPSVAAPMYAPRLDPLPTLYETPTRGSLAGDADWLTGVAQLSWLPDTGPLPPGVELPDPPVDTRRVAFAGDVPGGRMALVLARQEDSRLVMAWFAGPDGAEAADMALVGFPGDGSRYGPVALWTTPDPAADRGALVLVGLPGDSAEVLTGRTVSASGETEEHWESLPMTDGAGAIAVRRPVEMPASGLRVLRERQRVFAELRSDDRAAPSTDSSLEVADPRGLRGSITDDVLRVALQSLAGQYVVPPGELQPTLLAGGPIGGGSTMSAALVGVTFPSGATAATLVTFWTDAQGRSTATVTSTTPAPAGTTLLDRVIAVPSTNAVTVSGPTAGVMAEIHAADGPLIALVPLVDGAGTALVTAPLAGVTVRIMDRSGGFLAQAPLAELG